jgi:hypothetical protein
VKLPSCAALLRRAFQEHPLELFLLAALATLPPELYSEAKQWDALNPYANFLELLWYPFSIYAELRILRQIGRSLNAEAGSPALSLQAMASSLGAELLFSLRFASLILLCLLPALLLLSIAGLESHWSQLGIALLLLAGSIPATDYFLRRLFTSPIVLWQGLKASAALEESARLCRGKMKQILPNLLLWSALSMILENLGGISLPLTLLALPLSFILNTVLLAWCYHILTL